MLEGKINLKLHLVSYI